MITSLAVPQQSRRPAVKQQATPFHDTFEAQLSLDMDPKIPTRPGFLATSHTNNPFLSPNTSETWSTDDESSSSSGQDEFHLERYSQDAKRNGQHTMEGSTHRGKPGSRSRRRKRPDLNIVTELPGSQVRAVGSGLIVEQVKAKKAATTRPKSVYSAKAEHVHEPFQPQRMNALAGLKETARLRHEKNKVQRDGSKGLTEFHAHDAMPVANTSRSRGRSDQKPVVIGISIPKEDADTRKNAVDDTSAITLRTPSIIVTPAAGEAPWKTSPPTSNRRPVSSVYSTAQVPTTGNQKTQYAPPVPQMPAAFSNFSRPRTQSDPKQNENTHDHRVSMDSWEADEMEDDNQNNNRRLPSESQERILPSATDPARPKSQGWWNLMLSPMLSRAGTQKSTLTRTPAEPAVPPLPSSLERRRSRSTTLDSQISPETPRRLGMAGARASTWSRWTAWEKQKDNPPALPEEAIERAIRQSQAYQAPPARSIVPAIIAPAKPTEGLAAEYYRACAIEQLSGESYFECENHSCSQKLPALQSVFDRGVAEHPIGTASGTERSVGGAGVTDVAHQRAQSESTNPVSPEDLSPNVRQADAASITKARAVGLDTPSVRTHPVAMPEPQNTRSVSVEATERMPSPAPIPMPSPEKPQTRYPNIAAIVPPQHPLHSGATVASPGPISPEMQRTMTSQGAVPMSDISSIGDAQQNGQTSLPPPVFYNYVNYPQNETQRDAPTNVYVHNTEYKPSPRATQAPAREEAREEPEKAEKDTKPSLFSRLKSCAKKRKSQPSPSTPKKRKRRWAVLILIALLLMIIGIVVAATQLTRHGDRTPTQQQWLNLTGYPPMPTGISTIIRPNLVQQQDQCVTPNTLWSCSLPKENQPEVSPNQPDQPNFRFEIKFRNGTVPSNMTIPVSSSVSDSLAKRANDPFTNELFTPNPEPASRAEQIFLGNTTDNITDPFDGEKTPFYMTFIPAFPVDPNDPAINSTNLSKRDAQVWERQDKNLSLSVPPPAVQDDGSAAPANLLPVDPFPFAQPIRLYNRGLQDEHYGFYMYYDKSIFLSDSTPLGGDNGASNTKRQTGDTNGGALRTDAKARCTFSQTRFLVRIYTNSAFPATLLNGGVHSDGSSGKKTNSATNYTPPGSFPYPASIDIDRHGGEVGKKLVYCYGVDGLQVIDKETKSVVPERRGAGGTVVNAAPGLAEFEGEQGGFDKDAGGADGGTGGCQCGWQNWS